MADVAGFRAIGYVAGKVAPEKALASAELSSPAARERSLAADPHNVMRLFDPGAGADSPLARWLEQGLLEQQPSRAMYRYHQEYTLTELGGRPLVRRALVCGVRLPSLQDGGIKTHQAVREEVVEGYAAAFLRHRLHAAPVLAAFRDPATEVDRLFRKVEAAAPLVQVQTADGVWHRLWRCTDAEVMGQVRNLFKPRKLYALDGHERLAGMLLAGERLAQASPMPMYAAGNYALMCLVNLEDQALLPSPCHRLVTAALPPPAEVLAKAARYFAVDKLAGMAGAADRLARELDGWTSSQAMFALAFPGSPELWRLSLLPGVNPRDEGVDVHPSIARFDPVVVEELFFRKVLGGPPRLFSPLSSGASAPAVAAAAPAAGPAVPAAAEGAATEATATAAAAPAPGGVPVSLVHDVTSVLAALSSRTPPALAVLARALPMQQVVHVADLGQHLPVASTHFFPPILAGLAMLSLTADEDLV